MEFYSINPTLTAEGSFLALANKEQAEELKPVALDAGENPFTGFKVFQRSLNSSVASTLGFSGLFSASADMNSRAVIYEAFLFTDKYAQQPLGGLIFATRWGAGLRLVLKVTDIKGAGSLGIGAVAAKVELGQAAAQFEIEGIGISDPKILGALPGPGDFDYTNYQKILSATDKVKSFMAKNQEDLTPRPFQVGLVQPPERDLIERSRSVVYAVRRIAKRVTMSEALDTAIGSEFDANTIRSVYEYFDVEANSKPSYDERDKARDWLDA